MLGNLLQRILDRLTNTPDTQSRTTQASRWAEYPTESVEEHDDHDWSKTHAPRVNYCYTCGRHFRPKW